MEMLKKATSGVPCLRRASFAEVATEAESGYAFLRAEALQRASAQAGRHFAVVTYWKYAPRVKNK